MSSENPELSQRLDLKHRNLLQIAVLRRKFDSDIPETEKNDWILNYGGKAISDIIDTPGHDEIRRLALEERYDEAANLVLSELKSVEADALRRAA